MLKRIYRKIADYVRAWRMARKPVDVLMRPFRSDIMKKAAFQREAPRVHTLVLGSSHAYNGYLAAAGEFNYGLRNCDLYHACALYRVFCERGLAGSVRTVVLFYDVFSPGFVMEKTSRGSLAIPYRHLWGIPYQCPLRIDHRAIERRVADRFADAQKTAVPEGYLGNAVFHRDDKSPPKVLARVRTHLKHNARPDDQTRYLEELNAGCRARGQRLFIVIPPVRRDYAERLERSSDELFASLLAFAAREGVEVLDLTRDPAFEAADFLDCDHLARPGAEKLTNRLRQSLG
ncbi:MAG: hypothetical protein ACI4R9_03285 [Kiritimatiellia bacterium]